MTDSLFRSGAEKGEADRAYLGVGGTSLCRIPMVQDRRGILSFAQYPDILPFAPARYFLILGVPGREVRGEHAHRECSQFLVCVTGSCAVAVDDGRDRTEVRLDRPNIGLHLPPMVWAEQWDFSQDAVLMVLASRIYEPSDYIRNHDDFLAELRARQ